MRYKKEKTKIEFNSLEVGKNCGYHTSKNNSMELSFQ